MTTLTQYPHISLDQSGAPRIGETRYKVILLAGEHYHYGWSGEELLRQHPDLRPEQVYAALTYFYDHHDEMVAQMTATSEWIESLRKAQPLTRDELLRRRSVAG
jgi:uncharacterized protein (DUF433 family)